MLAAEAKGWRVRTGEGVAERAQEGGGWPHSSWRGGHGGLARPLSPWAARGGAGGRGGAERDAVCAAAAAETIVRIVAREQRPAEPDGKGPSLSRSSA